MNLRPYQIEAINEARQRLATRKSVIITAPTGAGKTIVAAQIIKQAVEKKRRVLFLAHRRELITQCSDKLTDAGVSEHGIIMGKSGGNLFPVQVASVQTLVRRKLPPADLVMIDEAHRAMAASYRKIIDSYPKAKVIGLTATPERLDGQGLCDLFEDMVVVATIPDLIDQGYLVAPTCYGAPKSALDLSKVKKLGGDYNEGQLQTVMDTVELTGEIYDNWQRLARNEKTIIFATGVKHSQHLADEFRSHGIRAAHVDGTTSEEERERIVRDWRTGGVQVVSNAMIFTEGFDFPELSCCVLARPTKSVALYLQMVGRVMRPAAGKTRALLLDHAGCLVDHDLPNVHREWTLEGEEKQGERNSDKHQCPYCYIGHRKKPQWYPESRGIDRLSQSVLNAIYDIGEDAGLIKCPGCFLAQCLFCKEGFEPKGLNPICPNCTQRYIPQAPESNDTRDKKIVESSEKLTLWEQEHASLKTQIKNEYKRLLTVAKGNGYKRGWVFFRLTEQFGKEAVSDAVPRHTGDWWRMPA